MYTVYAIIAKDFNRIYVGLTENLQRRLKEHNNGRVKSTKFYRPWALLYSEQFDSRTLARKKEIQLKSGCGKEFLKKIRTSVPIAQLDRAQVS